MRHILILAFLLPVACGETVAPEPEAVRMEITSLDRTSAGQWLAQFSITNVGTATVFLPRCDEVHTLLERWTGSEWSRFPVEACIAIRGQNRIVLDPGEVLTGARVIPPAGRWRLHVPYSMTADDEFDRIAATQPIDTD